MNMKRQAAVFLCTLILLNTFPITFAEDTTGDTSEEGLIFQTLPLEGEMNTGIDETPVPLTEHTPEPIGELLPSGEAQEPQSDTTPELGEEPPLSKEMPFLSAEEPPAATVSPTPLPTEEPSPPPTQIPAPTKDKIPEFPEESITLGNPSKDLPAGTIGAAKMSRMSMAAALSTLTANISLQSPDYINLIRGDLPFIRVKTEVSGGTGTILYAFDLYKDGTLVDYMPTYSDGTSKEFTVTQPGRYHVLGYVYESETGTELIRRSADTGVSNLGSLAIAPDKTSAIVGDIITWSVESNGAMGELSYAYTVSYEADDHFFSIGSGKIPENNFSIQAPLVATYRIEVEVYEPFIHPVAALSAVSEPDNDVIVGNPDSKVEIVSIKPNPDRDSVMIGENVVWQVTATGGTNNYEYKYQLYARDELLLTTDWLPEDYLSFIPTRSGFYRVDASVRNKALHTDECSMKGESIGVSGLQLESVIANMASAYSGDSLTWTTSHSGGTGDVEGMMSLYKDGEVTGEEVRTSSPVHGSFLLKEPGVYRVQVIIGDDFTSNSLESDPITITTRPGAVITKTEAVSGSSVKITWKAVTGATGYVLHRSTSKTGIYTPVYTGTSLSRTDTGRTAGIPCFYKVSSYKTVNGIRYDGDFGLPAVAVALAKPATPATAIISKTSVKVSWAKVTGATGYELWRSNSASGTYTRVYRGTALTFTNKSLTTNRTYCYKVKAYKLVGTTSFYSPLSAYRAVTPR